METKVINLKYEMPVEELESMAETAEGGIGYWAINMGDNIWCEGFAGERLLFRRLG